jgi:phosphoribosylanthranilate isomerase
MITKICGITVLEDAIHAAQAGADMLGFNFYPASPRYLTSLVCQSMTTVLRQLYPELLLVGVFVNEAPETIQHIMTFCDLDLAQCSGDESPEMIRAAGPAVFKALRPKDLQELQAAEVRYPVRSNPPAFLIDAYRPGEFGGTGQKADWRLAAGLAARLPIVLAGGLNPDNVADAVRQVQPWGVDVASGVESSPGRKDPEKVDVFIAAAHGAAKD